MQSRHKYLAHRTKGKDGKSIASKLESKVVNLLLELQECEIISCLEFQKSYKLQHEVKLPITINTINEYSKSIEYIDIMNNSLYSSNSLLVPVFTIEEYRCDAKFYFLGNLVVLDAKGQLLPDYLRKKKWMALAYNIRIVEFTKKTLEEFRIILDLESGLYKSIKEFMTPLSYSVVPVGTIVNMSVQHKKLTTLCLLVGEDGQAVDLITPHQLNTCFVKIDNDTESIINLDIEDE